MANTRIEEEKALRTYLGLITIFYAVVELSFFIQCNKSYLPTFHFIADKIQLPLSMVSSIVLFVCVQIAIHLIFWLLTWHVSCSLTRLFKVSTNRLFFVGICIYFLGLITVLIANYYLFPNAKFSELIASLVPEVIAKPLTYLLTSVCICLLLLSLLSDLLCKSYFTLILTAFIAGVCFYKPSVSIGNAGSTAKPNIFIVGVDSLRPDFLSYFGYNINTPFMDKWLHQATIFTNAVTPLARTYPSWATILTGLHPKQNGVRTNLARHDQGSMTSSLAHILSGQGYHTIYASDETRFSNIDHYFGFQQVITPPVGLNDFLIGTFNDFPFSNLLVNTKLGQWLFPFSYANRPVYFTYDPDSFLELLKPALARKQPQPLFLAVHFCLPHQPYLWSQSGGVHEEVVTRYKHSIERVDQQLSDFFTLLEKAKLLDHAIVILLSDHGEALELSGDRLTDKQFFIGERTKAIPQFYPPSMEEEDFDQSAGHGTDVLSYTQYHSLLAFRLYNLNQINAIGEISQPVSLQQVKPTILALLAKNNHQALVPVIVDKSSRIPDQHIFTESDFSPQSLRTVYPEAQQLIQEGIGLYQVDPLTMRLFVKPEMEEMIIQSKQYADLYHGWMLAYYPVSKGKMQPILVNLRTKRWTNDLASSFAKNSPAADMIRALRKFYGNELQNGKDTI